MECYKKNSHPLSYFPSPSSQQLCATLVNDLHALRDPISRALHANTCRPRASLRRPTHVSYLHRRKNGVYLSTRVNGVVTCNAIIIMQTQSWIKAFRTRSIYTQLTYKLQWGFIPSDYLITRQNIFQ